MGGGAPRSRGGLARRPASASEFPADMPEVLKATLTSLVSHEDQEVAQRAIYHLYQLVTRCD